MVSQLEVHFVWGGLYDASVLVLVNLDPLIKVVSAGFSIVKLYE